MPTIDRSDPPYLQVAAAIRGDISSGSLSEGDVVPSARQIAADWGIALATATRALNVLRSEGLVIGRPGVGTVVTSPNAHRSPQDWSISVHRTGRIYPAGHYARIAAAELVAPSPEHLAAIFGRSTRDPLIRRRRTTFDQNDRPVSASTSWFDGALQEQCPLLLVPERLVQGTSGYIAEQTGRHVRSGHDWFAAGTADADVATDLGVEVGSAVLLAQNRWFDQNEEIVELGEAASPPLRWAFYPYTTEGSSP